MTAPRLPLLIAACASAGALALAGCEAEFSAGETLNTDKAEREIAKGIRKQTGVTATVSCPDDVKVEQGATFTCQAKPKNGGQPGVVTVRQTDDEGNISWRLK